MSKLLILIDQNFLLKAQIWKKKTNKSTQTRNGICIYIKDFNLVKTRVHTKFCKCSLRERLSNNRFLMETVNKK